MKRGSVLHDISLTPEMELQYSSNEDEEEIEEEEEEEEKEEEEERIDRKTAIETYKSLQAEGRPILKKNFMLLKKLACHLKKHKVNKCFMKHLPTDIITSFLTCYLLQDCDSGQTAD
jgi:replicative superfamily II helicase